jgi:Holliday junction resolvase RusA-like endonuclease
MKSISFTVDEAPAGKKRPKFTTIGGYARSYTPADTLNHEQYVKACFLQSARKKIPLKGPLFPAKTPLAVRITCYYPIPKSTSIRRSEQMAAGEILPVVKPDLDNVAKLILDALNGVAWHDDNQITRLEISKVYGDKPHTDVYIETIEGVNHGRTQNVCENDYR